MIIYNTKYYVFKKLNWRNYRDRGALGRLDKLYEKLKKLTLKEWSRGGVT